MTVRIPCLGLLVADPLFHFVEDEVLPAVGLDSGKCWSGFDALVQELAPRNLALLAERDGLQAAMDDWHRQHPVPIADMAAYIRFLEGVGYLQPRPAGKARRCSKACLPSRWSPAQTGPLPNASRNSTTTCKAFWATWCAG